MSLIPFADEILNAELDRRTLHEDRIRQAIDDSLAPATRKAYRNALTQLTRFAERENLGDPFSPSVVAAFITDLAARGRSLSTITITMAALRMQSLETGVPDPGTNATLRRVLAGVRRELAGRAVAKAHALTTPELARILDSIDRETIAGKRDAAVLCTLYAAALRRSELAGLDRGSLTFAQGGFTIRLTVSKTDQFGERGDVVGVAAGKVKATDPVAAMSRWLAVRKAKPNEPVFVRVSRSGSIIPTRLTGTSINTIVKTRAEAAGVVVPSLSSHSGRSGHVTTSAQNGVPVQDVMKTTRHRSIQTILGYYRPVQALSETSSSSLGL